MALASLHRSTCSRATSSVPGVLKLTSWKTMGSSYRFPVRVLECDLILRTMFIRSARPPGPDRQVRTAYAGTTWTSSSVTSPATMR